MSNQFMPGEASHYFWMQMDRYGCVAQMNVAKVGVGLTSKKLLRKKCPIFPPFCRSQPDFVIRFFWTLEGLFGERDLMAMVN